jgi:sortase A
MSDGYGGRAGRPPAGRPHQASQQGRQQPYPPQQPPPPPFQEGGPPPEPPRRLSVDERATVVLPVVRSQYRSHRRRRAADGTLLPESPLRKTVRITGEVFITFGLVVLLFAGYEVWGKQIQVHHAQNTLAQQLQQRWAAPNQTTSPDSPPLPGNALAKLYIPKLGLALVVVQGVTLQDIRNAPGHYPESAMPGQLGNFAVAGHREKGIFMDLNKLADGDQLIVQTQRDWYVYKIYKSEIVLPTQVDVVNAVPDQPDETVKPTKQLITLTTCNPWWDNYQRLIIHGELSRQQPTSKGEPDELGNLKD